MTSLRARRAGLVVVWLLAGAGCSNSPTSPSSSVDTTVLPASVSFPGVVGPGGSVSRSFAARAAGTATATVSAITPATPLSIGFGVPKADGSGCLLALSVAASDGTAATVHADVAVGTYCVQVFAPARTAAAVSYAVVLEHP